MVEFDDLTDEQQAAADALDRNVTLTAGAGTGKTTTLTARYMRMLERALAADAAADDAPAVDAQTDTDDPLLPEGIVTTTFTERAANELERSVREAIVDRTEAADAEGYAAWRELADGLEEGYIHTLHGFCVRLLREHALALDALDPGFDTLDEIETAALVDETVAALLETHDDHEAVRTLARRYGRSALQAIVADLLTERPGGIEWAERWADASREEYLDYVDDVLHPVSPDLAAARLADPAFVDAVETLELLVADPPDALDTGGRAWERAVGVLDRLDDIDRLDDAESTRPAPTRTTRDQFVSVCDHLTTGDGDRYSSYTGAKGRWSGATDRKRRFDGAMETVVAVLEPERHLVSGTIEADANSFPFVRALARVTRLAHEAYTDRKRRQNVVDFADQIELILKFLTETISPERKAELRDRFAYVMVDEFQDTDPRQWEIIAHLTAENPEEFDARNAFVVGDVKQSIYRFRNADVTQFDETAAELAAANPQSATSASGDDHLSTNFRTLPDVLGVVNALFDEVFDADGAPYEARPQPLTPARGDPEGLASVEYLAVPTDAEYRARRFGDDDPVATATPHHDAELEATALAARLTRLFDRPAAVYEEGGDLDDPTARDLRPDDVAILLRSRTHLKQYERALEDADVPFTVASGLGFYETPEVTALVNLFRALADPSDERALYGALRSPLFGLTDETVATLTRDGESLWDALAGTDHDELRDAFALLRRWREELGVGRDAEPTLAGSWAAFLSRVVDETGYLASVAADERPQQAVANVEKFREQLRGYGDEGVTSLATLVRRIERRRSLGTREGEATVQGGGEGVQLLTVHEAKGMEFPVVVVPGIGRQFNTRAAVGDGRVEFEQVGEEHAVGLKAPDPDDPFETTTTVAREALAERRTAEERAEEKRVLYVACTRARDRLLLTGRHELDGDGEPSMCDVKDADPDEATSWRDWVQPQLLTDELLAALDDRDRVTGTLDGTPFTVSVPTPAVDWTDDSAVDEPVLELSATPPRPHRRFALSPTDLAALFDGDGSLRLDDRPNTVFFESERRDETPAESDRSAKGGLPATVFGNVVHRLCELRPPADRWDEVLGYAFDESTDDDEVLTPDRRDRLSGHARRAIDYVDDFHAECVVEHSYDELAVTATFDRGEVSGLVDHLVVTPDAYHVVDYKTNDVASDEIEAKADYYRTQLAAYAVALHQQDSSRAVTATLYFTTPGESSRFRWSPSDLDDLHETLESDVLQAMAAVDGADGDS